jgi:hypothetical protein
MSPSILIHPEGPAPYLPLPPGEGRGEGVCGSEVCLTAGCHRRGAGYFGCRPSRTSTTSFTTQLMFSIAV